MLVGTQDSSAVQEEQKRGVLNWCSEKWETFKAWLADTWLVKTPWSWWISLGNKKDSEDRNGLGVFQDFTGMLICLPFRAVGGALSTIYLLVTSPKEGWERITYIVARIIAAGAFAMGVRYNTDDSNSLSSKVLNRRSLDMKGLATTFWIMWVDVIVALVLAPTYPIAALVTIGVGVAIVVLKNWTWAKQRWNDYSLEEYRLRKKVDSLQAEDSSSHAKASVMEEAAQQARNNAEIRARQEQTSDDNFKDRAEDMDNLSQSRKEPATAIEGDSGSYGAIGSTWNDGESDVIDMGKV